MKKILTITGALLSLVLSACSKPEQPVQPKPQTRDDIKVEDYANNIIEYDDFDISYSECTEYGAVDPTYDACHNMTNHDGDCSSFIAKRCAVDKPNQCECIKDGNLVECNNPHLMANTWNKSDDTSAHRHKYTVSTDTVGVKVTSCNATTGQNETVTVKAVVRKMCVVDVPKDDIYYKGSRLHFGEQCECNIIKDNCENYVDENGRAVYKKPSTDGSCLGRPGRSVSCDNPEVKIVGNTVSGSGLEL